ncbi:prepilin-type N-terminal cleavage/methylation domain-containing protein [Chenggangzhangella methanolivorans]|uniref:Prepilin-type N-terminal cleavage/methylation domain-containing protein n=1 Tax=Chenggangzhangella methanolivorans TaxID=1437009 RepID=A0A9E6RCI0_9HYPH|nr:prepilin-type N-terminal cleavage/methylation domain-containing protein [Chenggangzhangella methanolivorans]QZO01810.1 prepilin-type N-terminal cleavage/methylation domain-containing protein [Chenggangzhangella methanolivorans]
MTRGGARAGFTLIETLVALVVLAVVMVVTVRGFVTARLGLDRAQSTLAAEAVARSLVETELDRLAAAPGVRTGETDGLAWTVSTEPIVLPLQAAPPPKAGAAAGGEGAGGDDPQAARKQAEEAARWKPMRVVVSVANGRGRPLTIETLHLTKVE